MKTLHSIPKEQTFTEDDIQVCKVMAFFGWSEVKISSSRSQIWSREGHARWWSYSYDSILNRWFDFSRREMRDAEESLSKLKYSIGEV